jgi:hypothetical protein
MTGDIYRGSEIIRAFPIYGHTIYYYGIIMAFIIYIPVYFYLKWRAPLYLFNQLNQNNE